MKPQNTVTVTVNQLAVILAAITHALPIAFSALVDARARKTANPFGPILKLSRIQAFTGFSYEASVNRQLDRENSQLSFTAQARSWGERISPALVRNEKTGGLYLVAKIERAASPVFIVRSPSGFLQPIARERIAAFLPEHKAATNQGTDKEITYRNYALNNLVSLTMNGTRYRIRGTPDSVSVTV